MQGQSFKADLRVIRFECSSIVLGIDWLKTYGKVTFDFQHNSITILRDGQSLALKGITEGAKLRLITAKQWVQVQELQLENCCIINHCPREKNKPVEMGLPIALQEVLKKFEDIFEEPKGLPPQRSLNHKIPLLPGV